MASEQTQMKKKRGVARELKQAQLKNSNEKQAQLKILRYEETQMENGKEILWWREREAVKVCVLSLD